MSRGIRRNPGEGERAHGNLVKTSTLTVLGNDDPTLLIRVLGPVAAQTVPVESVSIIRRQDGPLVHIVLVLRTQPSVSETIARKIGRLVDVAQVEVAAAAEGVR